MKKIVSKIFPIVDSNKRKEVSEQKVLNSTQKNIGVINIHRYNKNNVGDFFCGPHHYFSELKNTHLDISHCRELSLKKRLNWSNNINNNALIIGGGGLLNIRHFERQMSLFSQLKAKGKKTVLWGLGHNNPNKKKKITQYNINTANFGLVGTRDYSMPNEYVPCVSCLHPIFDKKFENTHEVGIVITKKSLKNKAILEKFKNYPSVSNTSSLTEMINLIGNSNTIVTDSYHAMYWAFLLEKKVVVIPTSSKFYDFKYEPVISSYENFEKDIKKAKSYSGILEESREINLNFAEKVFNYLTI
ncbi:exopolysaccharide biosynthesis predicted pyruvyl transferase EpsI [Mesonia hippocampi]|uniref:Exopolysaccharide biosynthesis predicted pyruvyl transferase EpsI n=1 Tax=Mesonia hippocampi TaxID=1628250 RepID=A0A840ERJ7_9FLAO|nr:polysaccharide pyruvyl transferase family protein [Mesonia hippocampi]MBB4119173.1 exopolysaccharide biosynthesis predicted pyruvyl transferase EpsI [Mesonia hippocampi]